MRFTIRDAMWLIVVALVTMGWCVDHFQANEARMYWIRSNAEANNRTMELIETLDRLAPNWRDGLPQKSN